MSSLVYWVNSESETIYSSLGYTVTYKPNLLNKVTGSNETKVRVEVSDERGRPLTFTALLSGPASDGVVEVGHVSGKGYGVKAIGRYVSEVRRVLMEAKSDPERSGMGMLILISTVIEEDGEYYAAADMVSVPIIPGKAVGKDIVVNVKFKPAIKHKIGGGKGSEGEPQEPPRRIPECYDCVAWELDEVLYTTQLRFISGEIVGWDYIPVAITNLGYYLGSKAKFIKHTFMISLDQYDDKYVNFYLSMGWTVGDKLTLYVPGPSYTLYIKKNVERETIYKINCNIYSTLSPYSSWCMPLISDSYSPMLDTSKFTDDALFSTGFRGRIWLVKYKYVYVSPLGHKTVLNDNVIAVWMEPKFNNYGKIEADWEIDDYPNDGWGVTERVLRVLKQNITYKYVSTEEGAYSLFTSIIYVKEASLRFAIPEGLWLLRLPE